MIYKFNENEVPQLNQVGGKARALIETSKAGFLVPEGRVLSVEFFSTWLKEIKASEEWFKMISNVTKENCDNVKKLAQNLKMTDTMKNLFEKEMNDFNGNVFAIRSSSPEEDLEGSSFAGMYETLLGQRKEKIECGISQAFSSCFDYRVVNYKKQQGIDLKDTSIAIIIQKQIASEISGVGFSLNPLNNCYDEVMINAAFGLGEAVVSGIVTPDVYIVDAIKNDIIHRQVKEKVMGLWLKEDGGIFEKPNEKPSNQALNDTQILKLTKLIKQCEIFYNKPVDIEWAVKNEQLYLLQVRPITTYLPLFKELLTKPGEKKHLYLDLVCMTQGFSESFSVLGLEIWKKFFSELGGFDMPEGMDGLTLFYHGRHYFHIPNVLAGLGKMGQFMMYNYDGSVKRIMNSYPMSEYIHKNKLPKVKKAKKAMMKAYLKMAPSMIKAILLDYKKVLAEYQKTIGQAKTIFKIDLDQELSFSNEIQKAYKTLDKVMMAQGIILAGINAERVLKKMFKNLEADKYIAAMGSKVNPTSQMGVCMFKLASEPEFQQIQSSEEFEVKLRKEKFSQNFMSKYQYYMENFGTRGYREIDIATKRTYETPKDFYERLKGIDINQSKIASTLERSNQGFEILLKMAKEKGCEKKFKKTADMYQNIFGYREEKKVMLVLMVDQMRRLALKKGINFVKNGQLDNQNDVFDLTISQITKGEEDKNYDLRNDRIENLKPRNTVSHIKRWPIIIDSRGKIFHCINKSEEGDLLGDPIANGVVRGRAKIILSPDEKVLYQGDILVTVATEPSWTPIFSHAAGVVMEIGGTLQHGAIIAREYGIPCVGGLTGATSLIKDGDLIEVDGTSGIVKILEANLKQNTKKM